jgi:hypothetical protein
MVLLCLLIVSDFSPQKNCSGEGCLVLKIEHHAKAIHIPQIFILLI